jgi:hypothetical protein
MLSRIYNESRLETHFLTDEKLFSSKHRLEISNFSGKASRVRGFEAMLPGRAPTKGLAEVTDVVMETRISNLQ